MKISVNGKEWLIRRGPSIFSSRSGRMDVRVMRENPTWGGREIDGKLYTTEKIFDSETGDIVRDYGKLPEEINLPMLVIWGFVKGSVTRI